VGDEAVDEGEYSARAHAVNSAAPAARRTTVCPPGDHGSVTQRIVRTGGSRHRPAEMRACSCLSGAAEASPIPRSDAPEDFVRQRLHQGRCHQELLSNSGDGELHAVRYSACGSGSSGTRRSFVGSSPSAGPGVTQAAAELAASPVCSAERTTRSSPQATRRRMISPGSASSGNTTVQFPHQASSTRRSKSYRP